MIVMIKTASESCLILTQPFVVALPDIRDIVDRFKVQCFHSPSIIAPMLVMQIPDSRRKAAFTFARRNIQCDPPREVESLLTSFPGTPPEMLYIVKHDSDVCN